MVLRNVCIRIQPSIRTFHTSLKLSAAAKKPPPSKLPASNLTPSTSTSSPYPPIPRPPENDPNYVHPPSSVKAGERLKGVQLLKDQPEIVALPDDYYPDWLWELMDDPAATEARKAVPLEIEKKKEIFVAQVKEAETKKRLEENALKRATPAGVTRSPEERIAVRREGQVEAWMANREKEYVTLQYPMAPERSAKYHKKIRTAKIKEDNYLRTRGLK